MYNVWLLNKAEILCFVTEYSTDPSFCTVNMLRSFYATPSVVFLFIFNRIIAPICLFCLWFFLPEGAVWHRSCQPARTCCDHVCSEQQWDLFCHTTKHKLVSVHWQWVCWGWCLRALKEFPLWHCIWTGNKQIKKVIFNCSRIHSKLENHHLSSAHHPPVFFATSN